MAKAGQVCCIVFMVLLVLFMLSCFAVGVVLAIFFVKPYVYSQSLSKSTCSYIGTEVSGADYRVCDMCDYYENAPDEYSSPSCIYPCFDIIVSYQRGTNEVFKSTLFDTVEQDRKAKGKSDRLFVNTRAWCSISSCTKFPSKNEKVVDEFRLTYGVSGRTFDCYYDQNDPNFGPIVYPERDWWPTFHSVLWPVLGIILSIVLLAVSISRYRRLKTEHW
ncbi:uncharacterized protein LOC106151612 [Lingula anatina]|uniref:Uncharacterized protein LOC106151612 n=1 Tax=Lingula anatina TaxID=7574 RepID=A0A1S3H5J9_LINAN|nr:uncharacterized protein LOC106151612 [Lingula anatina]|eukprot:XP_013380409.1 uncharacterized protein LOC106151612 [Lingula anatina]